jgi:hypothetical protein
LQYCNTALFYLTSPVSQIVGLGGSQGELILFFEIDFCSSSSVIPAGPGHEAGGEDEQHGADPDP